MLTEKLMRLTVAAGSEWVMVLLLILSVVSIAVIVDRILFFRRERKRIDRLDAALDPLIASNDISKIREVLNHEDDPTLKAAIAAHDRPNSNRESGEKIVISIMDRQRLRFERRLTFLGTLGNNAPFIGLFGTVLGIIRAFHDLSLEKHSNTSAVMTGISEALVATAIGLFVALPAVLFFNHFQKQVDRLLSINGALAQGILASLPSQQPYSSSPSAGLDSPDGRAQA